MTEAQFLRLQPLLDDADNYMDVLMVDPTVNLKQVTTLMTKLTKKYPSSRKLFHNVKIERPGIFPVIDFTLAGTNENYRIQPLIHGGELRLSLIIVKPKEYIS